jgi:hypothetical protein
MPALNITFPGNLAQVDAAADLRAIPSTFVKDNYLCIVTDLQGIFTFDPGSTEADDDSDVIRPDDRTGFQPGRWIRNAAGFAPGRTGASNNTRTTLAALKSAPITDVTSLFRGQVWVWTPGNFVGMANDIDTVQADGIPLTVGAWRAGTGVVNNAMLLSGHRSDQAQAMDLFITNDGATLRKVNAASMGYNGPGNATASIVPALGVRDPSITYWQGRFWLAYTVGFDYNYIGLAVSDDLRKWQDLGTPQPANSIRPATGSGFSFATAAFPNTKRVYAPRWFIHPQTGALYLEAALSNDLDAALGTHYMVSRKLTAAVPSASPGDWEDSVSFGIGFNYIDGTTADRMEDGKFVHFVKNETTKFIERFENTVYGTGSGWVKTGAGDWAGWGGNLEAPRLAFFNGLWHIYLDPFNGFQYYHATFTTLRGQPSAKQLIDFGASASSRHLHPLPISAGLHDKVYDSVALLGSRGDGEPADYVINGMNREAQVVNSQVLDGDPIASNAFTRLRAGSAASPRRFAVEQVRRLGGTNDGIDRIWDQTLAYIAYAAQTNNVSTDIIQFYENGLVEAPGGFKPRPAVAINTFQNGWDNGTLPVTVTKTATGVVQVTGNANKADVRTGFETMFVLPVGYRPPRLQLLPVVNADTTVGTIAVLANGTVQWGAGAGIMSLDGLTFIASTNVA